jgi:hypothetical protein
MFSTVLPSLTSSRGISPVVAGRMLHATLTLSAGTNWSGSPFSVAGIDGAFIGAQVVTSTTAELAIYTGDASGTLYVTDAINGTTAIITVTNTQPLRKRTGNSWYVKGGIPNPGSPNIVVVGTGGTTTYLYQVVAKNSAGGTISFNASAVSLPNAGTLTTWLAGTNIATLNNGNAALSGSNYNSVAWPPLAGATSYDLIVSTDGTTWFSMAGSLNVTLTVSGDYTYNDTGLSRTAYSFPVTNTTLGNDTNGGGFAANGSGTNYALNINKNTAGNNISTTDAVANGTTTLTSNTASFTQAISGNIIYLHGGTGSLVETRATATFVDPTHVVLSASIPAGTGITMNIGGQLATASKASTLAVGGDQINFDGFVIDSGQIAFADGVLLQGVDRFNTVLYSTYAVLAHVAYLLPSGGDVKDLCFQNDATGGLNQFIIGCRTGETAVTDCNVYRCRFIGRTNCFRTENTCSFTFTRCAFFAGHGAFGLVVGAGYSMLNLTDCLIENVSSMVSPLGSAISTSLDEGWLCARDCRWRSHLDSQCGTPTPSNNIALDDTSGSFLPVGLVLINCDLMGNRRQGNADLGWITGGGLLAGIWLKNTPLDATWSYGVGTPSPTFTVSSVNTNLPDPLVPSLNPPLVVTTSSAVTYQSAAAALGVPVPPPGQLVLPRGDTWSRQITSLGPAIGTASQIWFTAKTTPKTDLDTAAIIQISKTGGLLRLNGAAPSLSTLGSLTVIDGTIGTIQVTLAASAAAALAESKITYDVQVADASGNITTLGSDVLRIETIADVTRATS